MQTVEYIITDPVGLHARPAGILVKKAAGFKSSINVTKTETGKTADAKRIMGVMALGVKQGDQIRLDIEGEDEAAAKDELEAFLKENL